MRHCVLVGILTSALLTGAAPARANCMVIDQIDKLHAIQTRLARDPDTGLFPTDIRQLRTIMRTLSNRAALDAVDGNALVGRGAEIVRFLQKTQQLLEGASLDDPQSVRPHFRATTTRNLDRVGDHLHDLRCTSDQVSVDRAAAAVAARTGATSDAEDLAQVMQALGAFRQEVLRPRNLFGFALALGAAFALAPVIRRWLILRRRRAKRHPANFATSYRQDDAVSEGSLLDINCFGAKLARAADQPLEKGDRVEIAIEDDWIDGQVVWSNQHYSGIQFSRAISLADVAEVIAQSAHSEKENGAPQDAASNRIDLALTGRRR